MSITKTTKNKKKNNSHPFPTLKNDIRPSTLSFGLLKIIFNESDSSYSTRLAGLCNEKKSTHPRRRLRQKKQDEPKSIAPQLAHYCSTEAFIHELQVSALDKEPKLISDDNEEGSPIIRTSPRIDLLMQQHVLTDDRSNSSLNCIERALSVLYESPRAKSQLQRPKTAGVTRNLTSVNAVGIPSRLSSPKIRRKKSSPTTRPHSASVIPRQRHTNLSSEATTYSQTLYDGRPLSAILQSHYRNPPAQRTIDSSCTIREAKGVTSRYNKPEELFGLKPEELFGETDCQPKILNHRKTTDHIHSHRPPYNWQDDIDKLVDLYNVHHSLNYRKPFIPPVIVQSDATTDLLHTAKVRRMSLTKHSPNIYRSRSPPHPKQSTFVSLNIPRRNSISQRPPIKLTNA